MFLACMHDCKRTSHADRTVPTRPPPLPALAALAAVALTASVHRAFLAPAAGRTLLPSCTSQRRRSRVTAGNGRHAGCTAGPCASAHARRAFRAVAGCALRGRQITVVLPRFDACGARSPPSRRVARHGASARSAIRSARMCMWDDRAPVRGAVHGARWPAGCIDYSKERARASRVIV